MRKTFMGVLIAGSLTTGVAAAADSVTHYAFKPKHVADVQFSGLDLQYQIAGNLAGSTVICIARGDRAVNKKISVDFFIVDDTNDGAFVGIPAARNLPISDTADAYCGSGVTIADPHRTPKGMRIKVTNSDTGEYTEVDLEMLGSPVTATPAKRRRHK